MSTESILVVDDNPNILHVLQLRLESAGFQVYTAAMPQEARRCMGKNLVHLVITDLKMPGQDGISLMEELLQIDPAAPVIILTAHGSIANAVEAMQKGAYSYLTKPFDHEDLILHIRKALEKRRLSDEIRRLRTDLVEKYQVGNLVGKSEAIQRVFAQIFKVASTQSTVLIQGESGTGKELVAKAIHYQSPRRDKPFVPVNCSAFPDTLLESELFGHTIGAFTGAVANREGLFVAAHGGTLFLDEIADASAAVQVKLLRVLQERELIPVGSSRPRRVDVRLITATNQDLSNAVAEKRFREDLFYRIHVIPIHLPPLRERREDIPVLAEHFLKRCVREVGKDVHGFLPEALRRLMMHDWPGNVRELSNRIEHAVVMASHTHIGPDDLFQPSKNVRSPSSLAPIRMAREAFERDYLLNLLKAARGNVSEAARMAGIQRVALYKLIKRHDISLDGLRVAT